MKKRYCASCRNSERKTEADYYVVGRMWVDNERTVPYQAYLCKDCFDIMNDHDHTLKVVRYISEEAVTIRQTELVRYYTGYDNFKQMCANYPTLTSPQNASREYISGIMELRKYYKGVTGKPAFR